MLEDIKLLPEPLGSMSDARHLPDEVECFSEEAGAFTRETNQYESKREEKDDEGGSVNV
jgi:hypothetical protein